MANPWLDRRVLAFAHQGGAFEGPSSTMFAMAQALANGATGLELDVHQSRDKVLVVSHDATVDATSNGYGAIAEKDFSTLRMLDNAFYFTPGKGAVKRPGVAHPYRGRAPKDARFSFARLEEVLEAFPKVFINLDIKMTAPQVAPYEELLAETLRRFGRGDDVIVASFHDRATDAFARAAPEIPTSPGREALRSFWWSATRGRRPDQAIARHAALQVPYRRLGRRIVTPSFVELAHDLGLAVHAWTVDTETEMDRLLQSGVDGIVTNRPSVLARLLERKGLSYQV